MLMRESQKARKPKSRRRLVDAASASTSASALEAGGAAEVPGPGAHRTVHSDTSRLGTSVYERSYSGALAPAAEHMPRAVNHAPALLATRERTRSKLIAKRVPRERANPY